MLDHPVFYKISIEQPKQERFTTFMSEDGVSVTFPFNWVKVEEIANIKY